MLTERHIWEIHFNDSSPVRWEAISKLKLIERSKAIFLMYGLNPGRHAAITEFLVDEDVSKVVPGRVKNVLGAEDFFRRVRDTLEQAASEKMREATAVEWLAWATDRGIAVHSKFRTVAERYGVSKSFLPLNDQLTHGGNVDLTLSKESASATITHKLEPRRNILDPAIDMAIKKAGGSWDTTAVYLALKEIALLEEPPFTGEVNGDALLYTNVQNKPDKITKEALQKRLSRRLKPPGNRQ